MNTNLMVTAAAFMFLALTLAPAPQGPVERCEQKIQGRLWPAQASLSKEAMRQTVECGQLYQCERGSWRHHWRQVAVPYWQLAGKPRPLLCSLPMSPQP